MISTEGAPSLRFLQGWAAMLPPLFDLICSAPRDQPHVQSFPSPALRKEHEGLGTRFVADAGEIKSLGHPL
jgi:hypothetical protein